LVPVSGSFIRDSPSLSSSAKNLRNEFLRHLDADKIGPIAGRTQPRNGSVDPIIVVNTADSFSVSVKSERDTGRLDAAVDAVGRELDYVLAAVNEDEAQ
jgi:hypothetical protein